jgi:BMFP domain-containing protein YqiC
MAQKAREENDALAARLAALEARLGGQSASDSRAD